MLGGGVRDVALFIISWTDSIKQSTILVYNFHFFRLDWLLSRDWLLPELGELGNIGMIRKIGHRLFWFLNTCRLVVFIYEDSHMTLE